MQQTEQSPNMYEISPRIIRNAWKYSQWMSFPRVFIWTLILFCCSFSYFKFHWQHHIHMFPLMYNIAPTSSCFIDNLPSKVIRSFFQFSLLYWINNDIDHTSVFFFVFFLFITNLIEPYIHDKPRRTEVVCGLLISSPGFVFWT